MNGARLSDQFGRPERVSAIWWITPAVIALGARSVCPPPPRSGTPPFDKQRVLVPLNEVTGRQLED